MGWNFSDNVNSVSKTRLKEESDEVVGVNSAKYDSTASGGIGLSATRPIGEESSFLINLLIHNQNNIKKDDDFYQSYGLTLALDTVLGGFSLSPYLMLSKSDYQTDADSFSKMYGYRRFLTSWEKEILLVMDMLIPL